MQMFGRQQKCLYCYKRWPQHANPLKGRMLALEGKSSLKYWGMAAFRNWNGLFMQPNLFPQYFHFFERKIITFKIQKLKGNYNSDFQNHFIFKTAQEMVSCCPTLPWYPECWSRCWRLVSILWEQMSEDSQAFPCHSRKARLAAELTANPLKHALGGMQPYLVPQARNLSGRVSGEAFPMDDHNDRAN